MNPISLQQIGSWMTFLFPPEWLRAALVLALFSTLVVIVLFTYLNRHSRKQYFGKWTTAWLFYGLFLLAAIGLENSADQEFLLLARRVCIGVSALYLFYGSLEFAQRPRSERELLLAVLMMVAWCGVATYRVEHGLWMTLPMFVLLCCASFYTGGIYYRLRGQYRSSLVLTCGFVLWGVHLSGFPFLGIWPGLDAALYLSSAVIAFWIAMGMMVQMIEEANAHNVSLVNEFQKGLAQNRVLEREVTHSEQRYRALFEAASDATFLVDLEGHKIIEVNQSAYRLFSRNGGALVGSVFTDICPGLQPLGKGLMEDRDRYEEFFNTSNDCQVFRTDGASFAAHGEAKLVNSNKRPVMQISLHEISEQAKVEQQLRKAEKLSALGTLVAGVAHELNNPLAVIMGYSQLLSQGDHLPEKSRAKLEKLVHESERAAKIVRNLLTFARPRDPQMTVVDINTLATAVVDACEAQGEAYDVEIEKRLAEDLPLTKADSNQIEQVLTNLVSNGIQAMSKHGEQRLLRVTTGVYGAFIRIAVEDTGPGIPAEVVPRIFEPFYSTRAPGEGTGLGLSISQTILEEHHGKIWVQSTLGRGAKFFVELPVVACARTNEPGLPCRSAVPSGPATAKLRSGRRILLVDDEPGILDVLKEALSYQGYQIQTAESGKAALERLEKETFDLIVSDLRMPEIGGEKLYHAVRKVDPGLANRIIFVTGDTVNHKSRTFLEWTGNQWFSKPFDVVELERTIDNFLLENLTAEDEEEAEVPAEVATA